MNDKERKKLVVLTDNKSDLFVRGIRFVCQGIDLEIVDAPGLALDHLPILDGVDFIWICVEATDQCKALAVAIKGVVEEKAVVLACNAWIYSNGMQCLVVNAQGFEEEELVLNVLRNGRH